jgi:hypothetical protein
MLPQIRRSTQKSRKISPSSRHIRRFVHSLTVLCSFLPESTVENSGPKRFVAIPSEAVLRVRVCV